MSSEEAGKLLLCFGPNAIDEDRRSPWISFLKKFWAPVPWMLEVTIALQFFLGKRDEAVVICALLVFNAILSFVQESRADNALALLKSRLEIRVRVLRDDAWKTVLAQDLVPGDVAYLRMGDFVPADMRLIEGQVLLDQSSLTGEALPVEVGPGNTAYAGVVVKRGEATGEVTATGARTYFGKTAELVRSAKAASHLEALIFKIVRYLVTMDIALVAALLVYTFAYDIPIAVIVPFALILLVASVPIALPATYTLATALGAVELAKSGVLVTRLSAIEDAASMEVLATDKTGTITQNRLALSMLHPHGSFSEEALLRLAALACDEATQDPIDLAILEAAKSRGALEGMPRRVKFVPFDPETKRSEAYFEQDGKAMHVLKGAPGIVSSLAGKETDSESLGSDGSRILAVAVEQNGVMALAGLVGLQDPPRVDSKALIGDLRDLGVRVLMISGDGPATARAIAEQVGIGSRVCPPERMGEEMKHHVLDYDVYARVLPEDKYSLVREVQREGKVVGMSGDGVNDAPALKQAEVGIAVANATDVAKAAASLVLTKPGLSDMAEAIRTSRRIYQRMLTYTLNKIIKTMEIAIFMSVGVMLTGVFVITPMLIVLLLFTNDFVTMSIATDNVSYSKKPQRWNVSQLMATAGTLAAFVLILSFTVFFVGRDWLHLPLKELQTLVFVMLVLTGQGNVYLVRERKHFWNSIPSKWLLTASLIDILAVGILSTRGILMAPIPLHLVLGLIAIVIAFLFVIDFVKVRIFRRISFSGLE